MKRCPNCFRTYSDDTFFCLQDGTTLDYMLDTASQPTIIGTSPIVFQTPRSTQHLDKSRPGFNMMFAYFAIGLLAIIAVGLSIYLLKPNSKEKPAANNENVNIAVNTDNQKANLEQEKINREKENLQLQKDKLELEKQKLNRDKTKLEQEKNKVQPSGSSSVAYISRPPSNVRETPNGTVQCTIRYKTSVNIYGSTNITDNNGVWYYTDVCGKMGVIHSTQFNF